MRLDYRDFRVRQPDDRRRGLWAQSFGVAVAKACVVARASGALRAAVAGRWSFYFPARTGQLPCTISLAESGDRQTNLEGRMFALALLKGYPNAAIIIFYVLASAIFALIMYRYHRSQIDLDH
jgi:hypothetical protein